MESLSWLTKWSLYGLTGLMGALGVLVGVFPYRTLCGGVFHNPNGSKDDWHEQPSHYGFALADVLIACPVNTIGVVLAFLGSR